MTSVLLTVGFVAVIVLLYWLAFHIDPHWASKDGAKFISRVRTISSEGRNGRWREVRATITEDGQVRIAPRGILAGNLKGDWKVAGPVPNPPKKLRVYLLRGKPDLLLRLPATSRAIPRLDAIAEQQAT